MVTESENSVKIQVSAQTDLYYAQAVNGLGVVNQVLISAESPNYLQDIEVHIEVHGLEEQISFPWSQKYNQVNTREINITAIKLDFKADKLFRITDTQPGQIRVHVLKHDIEIARFEGPISILSPDSWRNRGQLDCLLLPAFSQPNDPAVAAIREQASKYLEAAGMAPMWSGYQVLPIVDKLAEALYVAITNLDIEYSNPPASWDIRGQRIRSASKILKEKVGTCLDTAMLFSSSLEAIGLYPVIVLVPGHAFVGYWTAKAVQSGFGLSRSLVELTDVINLIDANYIKLFETTVVTKGKDFNFDDAQATLRKHLTSAIEDDENSSRHFMVDVVAVRRDPKFRVYPMPAVAVNHEGLTEVHEYKPDSINIEIIQERINAESGAKTSVYSLDMKVPPRVKYWLESLLDLSLRNPLINFKTLTNQNSLRQNIVKLISIPKALGVIEDLLQSGQQISLSPGTMVDSEGNEYSFIDARGEVKSDIRFSEGVTLESFLAEQLANKSIFTALTAEKYVKTLRKMSVTAKSYQEETGSNGLHLAIGSLVWKPATDTEIRSPLILLPIKLISRRRNTEFSIEIDASANLTPNYSLIEKLKREFGIKLPLLENLQEDSAGIDINGTIEHVRQQIINSGHPEFRVDEDATIGFFDFLTYRLWIDLLENWESFAKAPLVSHLIEGGSKEFKQPDEVASKDSFDLDELISRLPIPADSSQVEAIGRALAGQTFILQGPPGTGKSQTITNLLASALHEGKRILFVAQKKDALDVVKERLDRVALGPFVLDLHDKSMSLKSVKEQLASVLDISARVDQVGFDQALSEYNEALLPLQKYRDQLHKVGSLGESFYSAVDKHLAIASQQKLTIGERFISSATNLELKIAREAIMEISLQLPNVGLISQSPWVISGRTEILSVEELSKSKMIISEIEEILNSKKDSYLFSNFVLQSPDAENIDFSGFESFRNVPDGILKVSDSEEFKNNLEKSSGLLTSFIAKLNEFGIDLKQLANVDLVDIRSKAIEAESAFTLIKSSKQGKVHKSLSIQLGVDLPIEKSRVLQFITTLLELKNEANDINSSLVFLQNVGYQIPSNIYMVSSAAQINEDLSNFLSLCLFVREQAQKGLDAKAVISKIENSDIEYAVKFGKALSELSEIIQPDRNRIKEMTTFESMNQGIQTWIASWSSDMMNQNGIRLARLIEINQELEKLKKLGLDSAVKEIVAGDIPDEALKNAFESSLNFEIAKFMMVQCGFETFDGSRNDKTITKFTNACESLRAKLPGVLASELLRSRGFDGSLKVGAIGDLVQDLTVNKRGGSVRALLRKHWVTIQQMTPCIMATPDAVVRFLDPSLPKFDLVIFDEASQMRVPNSIGALGRAKAAVIAGDSKQMPPTMVAQSSILAIDEEGNELEEFEADLESILSQSEVSRVPDIMLKWHYRSADESLIAFSNEAYYDRKLHTFPTPSRTRDSAGLSFQLVKDGLFVRKGISGRGKDGTNPQEVKAIINEIAERLANPKTANDSIGVVTLNAQQRDAVLDALLESDNPLVQNALQVGVGGEEIFVKNLETVQGSERDVILFSVAFSKNEKGRLPLNFGPMNNAGGERRLNVAITRARKQVKVFCSFEPEELISRNPVARGVIDLAQFLKLAQIGPENMPSIFGHDEAQLDRHRGDIATALRATGLHVVEDLGLSEFKIDLALYETENSESAIIGLLLDGYHWNERGTVFDRDSLPSTMLEQRMNWPMIARVWLPDWFLRREATIERIRELIEKAKSSQYRDEVSKITEVPEKVIEVISTSTTSRNPLSEMLEQIESFRQVDSHLVGQQSDLDRPYIKTSVNSLIERLTNEEGPVSSDRAAKYIGACFGFGRVTTSRRDNIVALIDRRFARDIEGFLYPQNIQPKDYLKWRKSMKGVQRLPVDVSLIELGNAMKDIAKAVQGIQKEQLFSELLSLLGVTRLTEGSRQRLDQALEMALKTGKLVRDGDYLR